MMVGRSPIVWFGKCIPSLKADYYLHGTVARAMGTQLAQLAHRIFLRPRLIDYLSIVLIVYLLSRVIGL